MLCNSDEPACSTPSTLVADTPGLPQGLDHRRSLAKQLSLLVPLDPGVSLPSRIKLCHENHPKSRPLFCLGSRGENPTPRRPETSSTSPAPPSHGVGQARLAVASNATFCMLLEAFGMPCDFNDTHPPFNSSLFSESQEVLPCALLASPTHLQEWDRKLGLLLSSDFCPHSNALH